MLNQNLLKYSVIFYVLLLFSVGELIVFQIVDRLPTLSSQADVVVGYYYRKSGLLSGDSIAVLDSRTLATLNDMSPKSIAKVGRPMRHRAILF